MPQKYNTVFNHNYSLALSQIFVIEYLGFYSLTFDNLRIELMNYKTILCILISIFAVSASAFSDTSLLHNVGNVQMLVSDWGAFTRVEEDRVYPNFIYSGKAYLDPFSDIWVGDSSGHVASAYDEIENNITIGEWIAVEPSDIAAYVNDSPNSDQTIYAKYVPDRFNDFPYKISIEQYSYAWNSASPSNDDYIIMKLILKNQDISQIKDFYIAIQTNWDVNYEDWEDDLMDWNAQRHAGIAYDSDGSDVAAVALALLGGKLASHNIVDANTWSFMDSDKSKLMSNAEIDDINTIGKNPGNYLNIVSSGPYNIPAGESVAVVYAFVAGQGVDELLANIDSAINRIITPEKLTAKPDENSVNLSWSKSISPDVSAYKIYRSKTSGSGYSEIAQVSSETNLYKDSSADKDSLSYYVVTAITSDGKESDYTNEIGSAPGAIPPAPSDLKISTDPFGKPILSWDAVQNLSVSGYRIFRNSTGESPWTPIAKIDKRETSFIDKNTYAGDTYYYTVATINIYNWISDYSNIVSLTLDNQGLSSSANNLKEAKIIPQPCSSKAKFINLTAMATINVYTLGGELVKTIYHLNGSGEEDWDLHSDKGVPLASGIYIYRIEAYRPDEADKYIKSGKLAISK